MINIARSVCWWLSKKPSHSSDVPNDIDRAIQELKELNIRQTEVLNQVKPPDILRSLVISMNSGRNQ